MRFLKRALAALAVAAFAAPALACQDMQMTMAQQTPQPAAQQQPTAQQPAMARTDRMARAKKATRTSKAQAQLAKARLAKTAQN